MAGYATIYTMAPVFSLVLDRDVNEDLALLYPELYKELTKVCFYLRRLLFYFDAHGVVYRAARCHIRRSSSGV